MCPCASPPEKYWTIPVEDSDDSVVFYSERVNKLLEDTVCTPTESFSVTFISNVCSLVIFIRHGVLAYFVIYEKYVVFFGDFFFFLRK